MKIEAMGDSIVIHFNDDILKNNFNIIDSTLTLTYENASILEMILSNELDKIEYNKLEKNK